MHTLGGSSKGALQTSTSFPEEQQVKGLLRAFLALRHRNYRLFWFGQLVSLIGTWMQSIGQAWLVLELTHSAWLLGIVSALQFLPVMLLSLFGGVFADRLPKRTVLLFTQSSAAVQAFILWILVFTGTVQFWHILILASLLGLTNSFDMPTRQAFVVEMVGREEVPNAVALNSSVFNMARIVGPGIGGLIIATLGVGPLFLLNAISFLPVIVGIALINVKLLYLQPRHKDVENLTFIKGTLQSLREGIVYVWRTPVVLLVIVTIGIISIFGINFNIVLPLFATNVLRVGATGFGFISSAFGFGALLSALWLAWGNHKPSIQYLLITAFVFCVFTMAFALSPNYILSLFFIAGAGFAMIAFTATANTTLQTVAPDHLRGRVMSVYMLVFAGTAPIGSLLIGAAAHLFGAPLALVIGIAVSFVTVIVAWLLRAPAQKSLLENMRNYE